MAIPLSTLLAMLLSLFAAIQYRKEIAMWAARITRTRYSDRCFDRLANTKNNEGRVYNTKKSRCDMASSVKYLKRVGISFLE